MYIAKQSLGFKLGSKNEGFPTLRCRPGGFASVTIQKRLGLGLRFRFRQSSVMSKNRKLSRCTRSITPRSGPDSVFTFMIYQSLRVFVAPRDKNLPTQIPTSIRTRWKRASARTKLYQILSSFAGTMNGRSQMFFS